jgi:hypothetical protein
MGELDKNELLCSIARSKEQIQRVQQWRTKEYKEKHEELRRLQEALDEEITRESQHHRLISQKLQQIDKLKAQIADKTPNDNGFRFETTRK